jgi:hypothetical protein
MYGVYRVVREEDRRDDTLEGRLSLYILRLEWGGVGDPNVCCLV